MPIDVEVIRQTGLEEPTAREREWRDKIDLAEYAIYSTKMELICNEAKEIMVNTGLSPGLPSQDCIVGLYTARGDLAAASVGTFLHVQTGMIPIKYMLKHFKDDPTVGIEDGDVFFCNEALYGGIHNPDQLNIVPIFWEGELIAWALGGSHETETGAAQPGGYAPNAKSRYEEGIKIPPIKIGSRFQLRTDQLDCIGNQVRDERMIVGDIRVRTAACFRVRERVLDVVREKGAGFVAGMLRRMLEVAAEGARRRIKQFNDGTYRQVAFFDIRGQEEALGVVHVALKKRGDNITIDLSGSSPPTMSYLNVTPHALRAMLLGQIAPTVFADLPASTGLTAAFELVAPENTCVNPPRDTPIGGAVRLGPTVVDAMFVCIDKMLFDSDYRERLISPPGRTDRLPMGGGVDQYGQVHSQQVRSTGNGAGGGARVSRDGEDACHFYFSGFCDSTDVEFEETQLPILCLTRRLARDQAGFGRWRGGAGVEYCAIYHNAKGPNVLFFYTPSSRIPVQYGIYGGYRGGMAPALEFRNVDWQALFQRPEDLPMSYHDALTSGKVQVRPTYVLLDKPFVNGDGVWWIGFSAGGYGDALERTPDLVMEDVKRGTISPWTAKNVYHVAFDEATLRVDAAETEQERARERTRRKQRGCPYQEFEKEWLRRKPSEEMLRYYGPWPWGIDGVPETKEAVVSRDGR